MKITWSTQARRDLRAIRDFIAKDSEHYARLQIERLIDRVERVAEMPSIGHPVHEFKDSGLREAHEGAYRLIYDPQPSELRIVTIVHMKQRMNLSRIK
jgi:addiction module RelE/StbE family toxin